MMHAVSHCLSADSHYFCADTVLIGVCNLFGYMDVAEQFVNMSKLAKAQQANTLPPAPPLPQLDFSFGLASKAVASSSSRSTAASGPFSTASAAASLSSTRANRARCNSQSTATSSCNMADAILCDSDSDDAAGSCMDSAASTPRADNNSQSAQLVSLAVRRLGALTDAKHYDT